MANNLVKGSGCGTREWREDFVLTDTDQTTSLFTVAKATGNTTVAGTLTVTGAQTFTGNTSHAGTLSSTGNFAVNTNKFTVAASSGNTVVAGTLAVTGATTLSSTLASGALTVTGTATISSTLGVTGVLTVTAAAPVLGATSTPASNAAGTAGAFTWDASYIYVCTASGVWKRVAITGGY